MAAHPSLSADPITFAPLRPVERMEPYVHCWCGSGKKYKWCHHRREQQPQVNIFEIDARTRTQFRDGYCCFPGKEEDACSPKITRAHTIQRRGGLELIAEAQHVLTVRPSMKKMIETDGKPGMSRIGIGKASVFPGFCSKHDSSLFKRIEGKTLALDAESAFLFAYRAIAFEHFSKDMQLRSIAIQRDMDRGHPFWKQVAIQNLLHNLSGGIRIGIRDGQRWKALFDQALVSGDMGGFHFVGIRFDTVLPFVAASAFHAEYDFSGEPLQQLGRDADDFEHMTVNVTAFDGATVAVLGWIGVDDGPAAALAQSFLAVADDRKADALLQLLFVQSDNIFLRPTWWDGLAADVQDHFAALVPSGTTMRDRRPDDLALPDAHLIDASVAEILRG